MKFINNIPVTGINRLLEVYKIPYNYTDRRQRYELYKHGIGYHDLLYAYSNEYDMITGNVPNNGVNGVYDLSGKVEKDQNDLVDPIPDNPYSYLSTEQLVRIGGNRDVDIHQNAGKHQIVFITILSNYDEIYPDWINNIRNTDISQLDRNQLFVKGGLHNINLTKINNQAMSLNALRNYVKLGIILFNQSPPKPKHNNPKDLLNNIVWNFNKAYDLANTGAILNKNNVSNINISFFGKIMSSDELLSYLCLLYTSPSPRDRS